MDFDCYKKEDTPLEQRKIDIKPIYDEGGTKIINFATLTDEKDIQLQQITFLSLWQRGNDPVFPTTKGLQWAEILLGEVFPQQVLEELNQLLLENNLMATASYSTENREGTEYLQINFEVL